MTLPAHAERTSVPSELAPVHGGVLVPSGKSRAIALVLDPLMGMSADSLKDTPYLHY